MEKNQNEQKEEYGQNKPIVESQISKSKDGKYVMHRTIITDIKPVKYYEKVLENKEE